MLAPDSTDIPLEAASALLQEERPSTLLALAQPFIQPLLDHSVPLQRKDSGRRGRKSRGLGGGGRIPGVRSKKRGDISLEA